MKNVIAIIKAHGGLSALKGEAIRIDPPSAGLMRLCIEYIGPGPRGQAAISIAHYYEQNGDLMQDPDVVVEVPDGDGWDDGRTWGPVSFTQAPGYYCEACSRRDGEVHVLPTVVKNLRSFLAVWDRNIGAQGFVEAFQAQRGS